METRSKKAEMIKLADRLAVESVRYFFERNASSDYGVETPFLVLIFGFVAAIYADAEQIDEKEHGLFLRATPALKGGRSEPALRRAEPET